MNNFEIIACDTDSVFFKKPDGVSFSKEEIEALQNSLNSLYPQSIHWEINGYFPVIVSAAAKNYLIKSEDGKIKFKGSAIKATGKEQALREFIQTFIIRLSEDRESEIPELYNQYVKEICSITNISRFVSKKTVTASVLNPERTNERKILDALKGEELQEGDKVMLYFKADRSLCLEKNFNGDYDKKGLLEKLFKSALIFDQIYPVKEKLPNYALKRNQKALESFITGSEEISNPIPLKTSENV